MFRLRTLALAGVGLLGLSFSSAEAAGWHRTDCRPVCPPPVVACAPVPCSVPVVTAPVVRTYYRPVYYSGPRVHYVRHCH